MYQLMDFFKKMIDFAYEIMNFPISFYGVEISLWDVFMFVLIGSILWWVVQKSYDND